MRHLFTSVVAGAGILAFAASAHANLIGVSPIPGLPDVTVQGTISYTDNVGAGLAGTGTFSITGGSAVFEAPADVVISSSLVTFSISINHGAAAGDPITVNSGTLTIMGNINDGNGYTTLFSSSVTPQFGFQTGTNSPAFDVLFSSGSGTLDPTGGPIGITLGTGNPISNYITNLFTQSFSSTNSSADVLTVPEPASLSLGAMGCLGLLLRRRRR